MKIGRLLSFILPIIYFALTPQAIFATTVANTFQITADGNQQTAPYVDRNMAVYTHLSDIWGYNFDTDTNAPVLERAGQQFTTHFFKNLVIYEDTPNGESAPDVRIYNIKNGKDTLAAGGPGAQTSGVTNGKVVAYIDGGACGSLKVYNIRKKTTQQIVNSSCHPIRISGDIIVYPVADPDGTNIAGYDLDEGQAFDIVTDPDFQEVPNIFGDNVVWLHRTSGVLGDPNSIKVKNLESGEVETIYESSTTTLNWPAISNKYVVWSESSATHVGGVQATNLKTGEIFEVQAQGPHQNSHTMPSIWRNIAVWQAFRTGNGDIYGSEFSKIP